jgi:hypothetical protein
LANWLHKSLRSDNVIFFRAAEGHVEYSKPYISGFDLSRPSEKEEVTEIAGDVQHDLYRHPHAQTAANRNFTEPRGRFKKSFDIYSLGVLFVEIAHWTPVDQVLSIDLSRALSQPSILLRIQEKLLAPDMLAELGGHMGDIYEKATRRCIAGGKYLNLLESDDETNDEVTTRLSMAFYEDVVKQLEDIKV